MNHTTLVSVTTEANVPISTATEAGVAAGEADEDQAEIRHRGIENVDHGASVFFLVVESDCDAGPISRCKG
jgi:hypothetical protein